MWWRYGAILNFVLESFCSVYTLLQAHKGNNKHNARNVAAFRYGNKNYRQIAMMNSVTLRQGRDPRTVPTKDGSRDSG